MQAPERRDGPSWLPGDQEPPGIPFVKYQALGNDYLVVDPTDLPGELAPGQIRRICDRHYGIGSDGLLLGPLSDSTCNFGLRLYNPDGSEFEKSGNGLRIFARYLWDRDLVHDQPFTIATPGGAVVAQVQMDGQWVTVEMGTISFDSLRIPVTGPRREVLNETLEMDGQEFRYCAATIGNPHCVVLCDDVSTDIARRWGPPIENEHRFPNRTNVQLMKVLDRSNIRIEIWERGAGYTLASGSSSCAAAAVARRLELCGPEIAVHMPGGVIHIATGKPTILAIRLMARVLGELLAFVYSPRVQFLARLDLTTGSLPGDPLTSDVSGLDKGCSGQVQSSGSCMIRHASFSRESYAN